MLTVLAKFFLMSSYGSYVKAIRKASTHLTEEPKKDYCCPLKLFEPKKLGLDSS